MREAQRRRLPQPCSLSAEFGEWTNLNWQIGKFIGSYGYTAKGHQCQAACGRPVFCWGGGRSCSLFGSSSLRFRWVGEHRVLCVVPAITIHTAAREILGKL